MQSRLSPVAGRLVDRRSTGDRVSEVLSAQPPRWSPRRPRVQLVDPPSTRAALLASALTGCLDAAGLEIWGVHDARGASRWLEEVGPAPDAVVIEIDDRPDRGGAAGLLGRVAPWLVIVVLTPTADTGTLVAALDSGADDALVAYAHPAEIVARVSAHLRRHGFGRVGPGVDG